MSQSLALEVSNLATCVCARHWKYRGATPPNAFVHPPQPNAPTLARRVLESLESNAIAKIPARTSAQSQAPFHSQCLALLEHLEVLLAIAPWPTTIRKFQCHLERGQSNAGVNPIWHVEQSVANHGLIFPKHCKSRSNQPSLWPFARLHPRCLA